MSARRGISLDEKRTRMLQIFHEKKTFFTLKEIEKIAPKEKGIVVQSVKDILQALVDDDLIRAEKIGTSIYYWKFPGENIIALERKIADTNKLLVEAEFKLQKLKEEIAKEKELKNDTEERKKLLQEVELLREKEQRLKQQVAQFDDIDPVVIAETRKKAQRYKDLINVWTDNVFAIQMWSKKNFGIPYSEINRQFGIPEGFDYISS